MRECCEREENLREIDREGDRVTRQCQVCGAKHHELTVDPVQFGIVGASLGKPEAE